MSVRIFAVLIVAMWLAMLGTVADVEGAEKKLIKFKLEDRDGKMRTEKEFKGKPLIAFASDKGGSKYSDARITGIQTGLKEKEGTRPAAVLAVADLSAIPSLMRGAVKRVLPKPEKLSLILDWEGVFDKAYGFKENKCNILVFSNSGVLMFQGAVTKVDDEKVGEIVAMIAKEQQNES